MHHRLVALRSFAEQEPDANQVDAESEIAFEPLNCDSDDEDDEKITQVSSSGYGKQKFSWECCNPFKVFSCKQWQLYYFFFFFRADYNCHLLQIPFFT